MATKAAALAPEVMPMTSGAASGLRSIVWKVTPARPKLRPATTAMTAGGSASPDGEGGAGYLLAEDDPSTSPDG